MLQKPVPDGDHSAGDDLDGNVPELDLAIRLGSLPVRLRWLRWAAATHFGQHDALGYRHLALMPPPTHSDEARRLYEESNLGLDTHRLAVGEVSDCPTGQRSFSVVTEVEEVM